MFCDDNSTNSGRSLLLVYKFLQCRNSINQIEQMKKKYNKNKTNAEKGVLWLTDIERRHTMNQQKKLCAATVS